MTLKYISFMAVFCFYFVSLNVLQAATLTPIPKEKTMMDQTLQFTMLTQLSGDAYLSQRNDLLSSRIDMQGFVPLQKVALPWQNNIQAKVLIGWQQHQALYVSVIHELSAIDPEAESKTVAGISRIWNMYGLKTSKEYQEDILPLAWEVILKLHNNWPEWKVVTFLHMLAAQPDEASVTPVIWLMENTQNETIREFAGFTLSKLPKRASEAGMLSITQKHIAIQAVIDNALYEMNDG